MIVFVAGMPRSGSTFSFNIVRCLLEARGTVYQEATGNILDALESAGGHTHLLLKGHAADEITLGLIKLGAIKAVCTVRKPEDAIASWTTTFGFTLEESVSVMEAWLRMFSAIRAHALVVPFEEIDQEPESAAWKIARHICSDADKLEVEEISAQFSKTKIKNFSEELQLDQDDTQDIGFSFYDKKTFFHRKHVTSIDTVKADDRIGIEQVLAIRQALAPWCDEDGNLR